MSLAAAARRPTNEGRCHFDTFLVPGRGERTLCYIDYCEAICRAETARDEIYFSHTGRHKGTGEGNLGGADEATLA